MIAIGTAAPAAGRPAAASVETEHQPDEAEKVAAILARARRESQQLQVQQTAFDVELQLRAEEQREQNALRDLQLEQMKRDDEVVKKWIQMI